MFETVFPGRLLVHLTFSMGIIKINRIPQYLYSILKNESEYNLTTVIAATVNITIVKFNRRIRDISLSSSCFKLLKNYLHKTANLYLICKIYVLYVLHIFHIFGALRDLVPNA